MFNNIHFQKFNPAEILSDDSTPKYWQDAEDYPQASDLSMYTAALEADYSISGSAYLLPLRPVSNFARKHYLYLQYCGLLHSDENDYTRRENYESYLILYTYSGAGYLEYEGKTYHVKEGTGFFIDCRKPHYYRTEGRAWNHSVLHFNGPLADHYFQLFANNGSFLLLDMVGHSYQKRLEKLLHIYTTAPLYMELQISNAFHQMLTEMIVKSESTSSKKVASVDSMRDLMKYIEDHYRSRITLDDMARLANISKYHLCREFKKYTGFPPNEYLIRLRIERAKALLQNTGLSIKKIAELVGIPDENNFTHLFKKHAGTTPGRYRTG